MTKIIFPVETFCRIIDHEMCGIIFGDVRGMFFGKGTDVLP
jgi:hypothetical protein